MGLKNVFTNGAATIFTAFGDVKEDMTYYRQATEANGTLDYDASTGVVSVTVSGTQVSGFPSKYNANQVDGSRVLGSDLRFNILQTALSFRPTQNDYIMRIEAMSSVRYEVVNFDEDSVSSIWSFQLRKP